MNLCLNLMPKMPDARMIRLRLIAILCPYTYARVTSGEVFRKNIGLRLLPIQNISCFEIGFSRYNSLALRNVILNYALIYRTFIRDRLSDAFTHTRHTPHAQPTRTSNKAGADFANA